MAEHEEKPWYPRIDSEPLLNPFANPQDGQPAHPVALEGLEDEESEEEAADAAVSPDDPLPATQAE
jgi:hypothetical protein